jgi:hypothetical protein
MVVSDPESSRLLLADSDGMSVIKPKPARKRERPGPLMHFRGADDGNQSIGMVPP